METNILVFEDDIFIAKEIEIHLKNSGYKKLMLTSSPEEAIQLIDHVYPDIAILDIRVPGDRFAGIKVAKYLRQKKAIPIIFLTGHPEDKSLIYDIAPDAFIEKPNYINLIHAIDLSMHSFYKDKMEKKEDPIFLEEDLFIRKKNVYHKVAIQNILYVQAESGCIFIHTLKDTFSLSSTLSRFAQQLPDPYFLQVYRSFLINIRHLESFDSEQVSIKGTYIPMSKSGYEALSLRVRKLKSK